VLQFSFYCALTAKAAQTQVVELGSKLKAQSSKLKAQSLRFPVVRIIDVLFTEGK